MNRCARAARLLPNEKLDALLVLSQANRFYLTDFHSTAGVVLVTGTGSWFFTDSRYIEAARRKISAMTVEEDTLSRPAMKSVGQILAQRGLRRVGIEDGSLTLEEYRKLRNTLPEDCELLPASRLLLGLRATKDEEEIRRMVAAQRIAEGALRDALEMIRPGKTEREIAAFLQYRMLLGGAERMSFDPIVVSGPNSSMPHGVPGDRPVAEGDFVTMDFGCVLEGYCSDMTRTVAVGFATEEMETVYRTVLEAQLAGIAAARAGVPGAAIHEAGAQVIRGAGYGKYFGHGFGHSLGIEVHETPTASPSCKEPIPAGAVVSAEPGIYLPGAFGVRIEDVIVLREDGCRNITQAPKELLVLK